MADIRVSLILEDQQFAGKLSQATAGVDNFGKKAQASFTTAGQSTSAFGSALRNVDTGVAGFSRNVEGLASRISGLATAVAGIGMIALINQLGQGAAAANDISEAFGLSLTSTLELQQAFIAAGRSSDDMSRMLSELNTSALEAAEGNQKTTDAFARLGVSMQDLTTLGAAEVIAIIGRNLEQAGGSAQSMTDAAALLGKGIKGIPIGDFNEKLGQVRGKMGEAAEASVALDQTMKTIEQTTAAVMLELTKLIQPVAEFFNIVIKQGDGARVVAIGLAGAFTLLSASLAIKGLSAAVGVFQGLAAALGLTGTVAAASAIAIDANTVALARNMTVQQAAAMGKAVALTAELAAAQVRAASLVGLAGEAAALATVEKLTWRVAVAKGNLAGTTAGAAAAQAALTAAQGAGIATSTGLTAATTLLGVRLATIVTAATAAAAALALIYSPELNTGEEATIEKTRKMAAVLKDMSEEQRNAFFKLSAADRQRIEDQLILQNEAKKTTEIMGRVLGKDKPMVSGTEDTAGQGNLDTALKIKETYDATLDNLRNQLRAQQDATTLAKERLELQIGMIGMGEKERAVIQSKFDTQVQKIQEVKKIEQDLFALRKQLSTADDNKKPILQEQIKLLEEQKQKVIAQKDEMTGLVAQLKDAEQAEKNRLYYQELGLKVSENVRDINASIADLSRSQDQQRLAAVERQRDAEITSAIKRQEADLGRVLTAEERLVIENKITAAYADQVAATDRLNTAIRASEQKKFGIDLENRALDEQIRLRAEADSLTMTADQRRIRDIQTQTEMMARQEILRRQAQLAPGQQLGAGEQQAIYEQVAASNRAILETTQKNIAKSREFSTGWKKAFNEYQDDATNGAKKAGELFAKISKGMEDSIVKFAKTGKFGFKEFVNSVVEDLLRMEARTLSTKILGGATEIFGGGGVRGGGGGSAASIPQAGGKGGSILGDIVGGIGKMFGGFFADGGMIPAGKYGIVGERGPEYISGPAQITPMGSTTVTYNIVANDARSFKEMIAADPGFIHAVAQMGARTVPGRR